MNIVPMSVTLVDSMGSDESVANAARVSFHKDASNYTPEQNAKLIAYLAKHNHWSPFGHAFLSFRIKAPIFVARQMVKHQVGLCWNEVSRRYVDDEPEFWFPKEWRGKPVNAKQGSSGIVDMPEISDDVQALLSEVVHLYGGLLNVGVAPEQARMVLPQNMMTEWIWSGSLAAFARVVRLRTDPHAQAETREIAEKLNALVPNSFSHSWSALLGTVGGSYPESDSVARKLLAVVNG